MAIAAIAIGFEAIAGLEAIPIRLEAIASRFEAIAIIGWSAWQIETKNNKRKTT